MRKRLVPAEKLATGIAEFETYIRNNREFIPNFGERYRQGETISTGFVESTINQVVSRRFVKKQQMQWTVPPVNSDQFDKLGFVAHQSFAFRTCRWRITKSA